MKSYRFSILFLAIILVASSCLANAQKQQAATCGNYLGSFSDAQSPVQLIGEVSLANLDRPQLAQKVERFKRIQRALDLTVAIVAIPVLAPVAAIAGVGIKIESTGPVFFVQKRVGQNGTYFYVYKLRTMRHNSSGSLRTAVNDSRISGPWAKLMRHWKIDEIPQLFNVLKGEMSIVGPRPQSQENLDYLCRKHPIFNHLTVVKPGLISFAYCKHHLGSNTPNTGEYARATFNEISKPGWRSYFKALIAVVPYLLNQNRI